jgi:murein DD-endopeptidase MepM/ murein hydrolase activator NlpD
MTGLTSPSRNWMWFQIILSLILLLLTARQFRAVDFQTFSQDRINRDTSTMHPNDLQPDVILNEYRIFTPVVKIHQSKPPQSLERPQIFNPTLRGVGPAFGGLLSHPVDTAEEKKDNSEIASLPALEEHVDHHLDDKEILQLTFPNLQLDNLDTERPALYPVPWAPTPYDHFYFSRPITADYSGWTYPDYRYGGVFFPGVVHRGVDLQAKMRTPILAAASGRVTWAGYGASTGSHNKDDPYGLAVIIRHDFGWQGKNLYTLYAHLDQVDVSRGQYIETGTRIGLSGRTGKATGPHLHFEVLIIENGRYYTYNPELWLVPPQGWGVLVGRVMYTGGSLLEGQLVTVHSLETNQVYRGHTYQRGPINSDPYYQENLVISDIPAGLYEIRIDHLGRRHLLTVEIHPGRVTYFTFLGRGGFGLELPVAPGEDFVPNFTP